MGKYAVLMNERINIDKMSTLSKVTYRFIAIPVKIPMTFFAVIEQLILKFVGTTKDPE